jgi:hypothetical protein
MIMLTLPPKGLLPLACAGAVMSMRIFGGEKNHFPVVFTPFAEVVEKSAENGCGFWACADKPARMNRTQTAT